MKKLIYVDVVALLGAMIYCYYCSCNSDSGAVELIVRVKIKEKTEEQITLFPLLSIGLFTVSP